MRARPALVLLLLALAGCASPGPMPSEPEPPAVITDPTQGLDDTGAHIHDYWGGGDRVRFLDATHPGGDEPGTGPGFAQGTDVEVRSFQPASGDVVPQGTVRVELTLSWQDDPLDAYAAPSLWVKTAADNAPVKVADVASGDVVTLEAGVEDADLPHQVLSAWAFELRMSSPDPRPLRFKGAVTLVAEAVRGDAPLPLFPAHPDHWAGATTLDLLEGEGTLSYWQDTGDGGCNGLSCPSLFRPDDGMIVPPRTAHVWVEVLHEGAFPIELLYRDAATRDLTRAEPVHLEAGRMLYELPAEAPDGPYAAQSQWEFTVLPQETGSVRTAWGTSYALTAQAVRLP